MKIIGNQSNSYIRHSVLAIDKSRMLVAGILGIFTFFVSAITMASDSSTDFPSPADWEDQGVVLSPSASGWDSFKPDGFGMSSIVKKDRVYYMYYAGSSGPRRSDGGPADRAIGVATSIDGVNFVKYTGNPIITHQPSVGHVNREEEGADSPVVKLDDTGNFIMYWNAKTATGDTFIDNNIHLSTSSDGFNFNDTGIVIPHSIDGGGDEVSPMGVLHAQGGSTSLNGAWHLWYMTDGFGGRKISLATGETPSNLNQHPNNPILSNSSLSLLGSPILFANGEVVILSNEGSWGSLPVHKRTTTINNLNNLSAPNIYFTDTGPMEILVPILLHDSDANIWRMYYTSFDQSNGITIKLKTAPLKKKADTIPPAAPTNLRAWQTSRN